MKSICALLLLCAALAAPAAENEITLVLEPTPENPRNSEGAFVTLRSGRVAFYYTQFYGGLHDDSAARIVVIHSDDDGRTWSEPLPVIEKADAQNVMSVSVLRLHSGRLAMFHVVKNSAVDCTPRIRYSDDEGATWSEPRRTIEAPGYFVLNNDRVIQTTRGRLILPLSFKRLRRSDPEGPPGALNAHDIRGIAMWFYSDDEGMKWKEATSWWAMSRPTRRGLQEPGVVELADGSFFSWVRTDQGSQWGFRSNDHGDHWTPPEPTQLVSPVSPASIKRIPGTDKLLAVYNDHSGRYPFPKGKRTPLVAAISDDGAKTWPRRRLVEGDPGEWLCYTAIHFTPDAVLLAYCAGDDQVGRLARLRIRRIERSWFPIVQQ